MELQSECSENAELPRDLDISYFFLISQSSLDLLLAADDDQRTFRVLRGLGRRFGVRRLGQGLGLLLALLGLLEQVLGVLDLLLGGILPAWNDAVDT